jgi:hypothetical protein
MRVLLHPGPMRKPKKLSHFTAGDQIAVMARVSRNELCVLPDDCIAEPVEVYEAQEVAHDMRNKLASDDPSNDYRVVLNTDAVV